LLALATMLSAQALRAQTTTSESELSSDARPRVAPVRESVLDVFYYRDASGKLVPVVEAVTLEELDQFKRSQLAEMARATAPEPYRFHGDVVFSGRVDERQAEVEAVFPIRLSASVTGSESMWVRVPLRMNRAILVSGPDEAEQDRHFVSYDRSGDGYVAWCDAGQSDHEIRLKLKVPLVREAGVVRFSLVAPAGPTRFVLTTPGDTLDVGSNNEEANIISTRSLAAGETEIQVENVGGPLSLTWRDRQQLPAVLKAVGTTRATINGRQIDSETALKVQSFGGPVETFDVRLPPGLQLVLEARPGIEVNIVEADPESQQQRVRVTRQDGKSSNSLEVKLRAYTPPAAPTSNGRIELLGFDVVGAVRQAGALEVAVQGDWAVDWYPGPYVRQVAVGPRQDGVNARFEYDRYPCSLTAEVRARESRVQIEPAYVVRTTENELLLEATLKYTISGAQTRELQVNAAGWTIDRVGPSERVGDTLDLEQTQPLIVPLTRNGPAGDEQRRIVIEAHRPIEAGATSVQFTLPRPAAGLALPATLVVLPADNVELAPRPDDIRGLVPDTPAEPEDVTERPQRSLAYREELAADSSVFHADFVVHEGSVAVDTESTLRISESVVAVEQTLQYRIDYEPISELKLNVPPSLAAPDQLQLFLDDRPLQVTQVSEPQGEAGEERVTLTVVLPKPRIQAATVVARYSLPLNLVHNGDAAEFAFELVQPQEDDTTTVQENRLRLVPEARLEVELIDDLWDMVADPSADMATASEQVFQYSGYVPRVRLAATLNETARSSSTVVDKLWIQSWIGMSARQDRACLKLYTSKSVLDVRLPAGAELTDVAVERQPREPGVTPDGIIHIDLGSPQPNRPLTVELWYRFPARGGLLTALRVAAPEVDGARTPQRTYWHLVLPRHQQLVWAPEMLTSESVWRWEVNQLRRQPNRWQDDLEALLAGTRQEQPAVSATNQYLFSSFGAAAPMQFVTIGRATLTLILSAAALLIGLTLIYMPALRHPAVLLMGGVAVLALGSIYPESAILLSQAAALGIVLVLLARLLQWNLSRRGRRRQVVVGGYVSSDSRLDVDETPALAEGVADKTTTAQAGTSYPLELAEPKS